MEKKSCKVVMLPTDKAQDSIVDCSNRLQYFKGFFTQEYLKSQGKSSHHLYIISEDKIEEGDWCLFFWDGNKEGELGQIGSEPQQYFPENGHTLNKNLRKIIATTNSELKLPSPSIAFIEKYCKLGGIDEVDVEYEMLCGVVVGMCSCSKLDIDCQCLRLHLKVNSSNEITIQPIKNSWSREEVYKIAKVAYRMGAQNHEDATIERFDKFIKENL